ncbi:metallophosphoesterase family protein [Luteococcus peritonei]|uniref:Metallophosphoesterase family protein n=1 Tax=Luteococcus peritonei TaxID=88874 RepID=A0ABW4RZ16_9ACTN
MTTARRVDEPAGQQLATGSLRLLSDPFLMVPRRRTCTVVWFTERPCATNLVLLGRGVHRLSEADLPALAAGQAFDGLQVFRASTAVTSRMGEDAASQVPEPPAGPSARPAHRHEARVGPLRRGRRTPYRVLSGDGGEVVMSAVYTLAPAPSRRDPVRLMLTSDHQDKPNVARNIQLAAQVLGPLDAVLAVGDLADVPDRTSEWFDSGSGSAFFAVMQGHGDRPDTAGRVAHGAAILQHVPIWPVIGNHEVMGRVDGVGDLQAATLSHVPREVAAAEYDRLHPTVDGPEREAWIERNSFSTRSYEEVFSSLPTTGGDGVRRYAVSIGEVRLITLFVTRAWRGPQAQADPSQRTVNSRHQDAADTLTDPLRRSHGEFWFDDIRAGSEQYRWLEAELRSPARRRCRWTVVQLHEGPHGLGENMVPPYVEPVTVEERDADGELVGIRYEYPIERDALVHELAPLLEEHGVDLVLNGHSHLWNRFRRGRTHYLEASNTGNSYGAHHPASGLARPAPGAPWPAKDHVAMGDPGGLEPVLPSEGGLAPGQPFVASNDHVVVQCLDSGRGTVSSWVADVRDPATPPRLLDEFRLGSVD